MKNQIINILRGLKAHFNKKKINRYTTKSSYKLIKKLSPRDKVQDLLVPIGTRESGVVLQP